MTTEPERPTDDMFEKWLTAVEDTDGPDRANAVLAERLARDEAWTLAWIGRRMSAKLRELSELEAQFQAMREHFATTRAPMDREIDRMDRAVKDLLLARRERDPDGPKSLTVIGAGKWTSREVPYGFDIDERETLDSLPPEVAMAFTREVTQLDTAALRQHLMALMRAAEPELPKALLPEEKAERMREVAKALTGSLGARGVEFRPGRVSLKGPLD